MSSDSTFKYDAFISYSNKNKDVVREIANRLKSDGVRVWFDEWEIRPGDSIPAKIEDGLECSRVLVLCLSAEALASDWPQLESHTFRFKDPLNSNRRFIPLKLDDAPVKGSLIQFSYIDWRPKQREQDYPKLFEACKVSAAPIEVASTPDADQITQLEHSNVSVNSYAFSEDGSQCLTGAEDGTVRLWDLQTLTPQRTLQTDNPRVYSIAWSADERQMLCCGFGGAVALWDLDKGTRIAKLGDHNGLNAWQVAWSPDEHRAASVGLDGKIRLWDVKAAKLLSTLGGHQGTVFCISWSQDQNQLLSGATDTTLRLWDVESEQCLRVFEGHDDYVRDVIWQPKSRKAISCSSDRTLRLWDLESGRCTHVLEGHEADVHAVALSVDGMLLSGGGDSTVRLWDVETGKCLRILQSHSRRIVSLAWSADGRIAYSGDSNGVVRVWDLSEYGLGRTGLMSPSSLRFDHVQYTNAKVLLVGNSSAGKTGLSNRLAMDTYKETDSTVGAWATQWKLSLPDDDAVVEQDASRRSDDSGADSDQNDRSVDRGPKVEREVWLWDFGGQADQRLIHQLYMDQTQVAALVFDPQKDDVFETLGQWDRDLSRAGKDKAERERMTKLLVAGRCDAGGLRVSRRQIDNFVSERGFAAYLETSAKTRAGCAELKQAIIDGIQWDNIPWRSSSVLFKQLKDEIIRLKDEGRVLMRFKELREALALRMAQSDDGGRFSDGELRAVIGLLAGPGVVWELEFGSWVLLQPERINAYAQAVIATVREDKYDRGCIPEERVLNGELSYQASIERLPPDEEKFVLLAMHQVLVERGLCIRHMTETGQILLIFPSYYRRERPELVSAPAVQVSYRFNGFLDDIYATLVVKLHHTNAFSHDELWRHAADFETTDGHQLGVKLTRRAEGEGELEVYFAPDVPKGQKIIFSKYVHEHLLNGANDVVRLRHYVCPHCGTPSGNPQAAMKLLEQGKKDIPCMICDDPGKRIPLWDELEDLFADPDTKKRVWDLETAANIVLDTESKERVLVGEVMSTVALAGQICRELSVGDHGIDLEIEFKTDPPKDGKSGEATGKRVYLQLKSGDSYLTPRKKGPPVFKKYTKRQAEYWMSQDFPVILVIRNSNGEIRWMEIRDHLKQVTNNGEKSVRRIEFVGQRFDVMSVRRWRDKALGSEGN